jgi:excisionase family DNA binding protein
VSENPVPQPAEPTTDDAGSTGSEQSLESLVGQWLTVPDAAEQLGVPLSRVRQLIDDREVLAVRIGERRVPAIPAKFFEQSGPRPELRGTFTVLADGGMDDEEIIAWLFTPDPTLPVEGAPIDAIRAGHKTEIRRRAQELAF